MQQHPCSASSTSTRPVRPCSKTKAAWRCLAPRQTAPLCSDSNSPSGRSSQDSKDRRPSWSKKLNSCERKETKYSVVCRSWIRVFRMRLHRVNTRWMWKRWSRIVWSSNRLPLKTSASRRQTCSWSKHGSTTKQFGCRNESKSCRRRRSSWRGFGRSSRFDSRR